MTHSRILELESELADLRAQLGEIHVVSQPQALETLARARGLTFVESVRMVATRETSFAFRLRPRAVEGFSISDNALEDIRDRTTLMLDLIDRAAIRMRGRALLEILDA